MDDDDYVPVYAKAVIGSNEEYSAQAHRVSHEAAQETNVIKAGRDEYPTTTCFHRTDGVEEQWTFHSAPWVPQIWQKNLEQVRNPDLDDAELARLVGRKIVSVDMGEDKLHFTDDSGDVLTYYVDGRCCSRSYFYDMHGKEKLLGNGPVVSVKEIELKDPNSHEGRHDEYVKAYGYEIVTEHSKWGEQTTVFSFRNDSNGYYGGEMHFAGIRTAGQVNA